MQTFSEQVETCRVDAAYKAAEAALKVASDARTAEYNAVTTPLREAYEAAEAAATEAYAAAYKVAAKEYNVAMEAAWEAHKARAEAGGSGVS